MAAEPLFMDAGGFYALVSPDIKSHELAVEIMAHDSGLSLASPAPMG